MNESVSTGIIVRAAFLHCLPARMSEFDSSQNANEQVDNKKKVNKVNLRDQTK